MTDSTQDAARRYAQLRSRLLLVSFLQWAAFLLIYQFSGCSQATTAWWTHHARHPVLIVAGYLLIFGVSATLVGLPLQFYSGYRLEHRFGLSRLTLTGWCVRQMKHLAVNTVFWLVLLEGWYAILRLAPKTWPIWATIGWVGVSVLVARIFPTVLLPLFYKTTSLQDEGLVARVHRLCQRVGVPILGVFRFQLGAETRKANAALAGLGATRRVLLSDTLIQEFSGEEIEGVLAHEIAHHHYHHITILLLLSTVGTWVAFLLSDHLAPWWIDRLHLHGLADVAGLPMFLCWLLILGVVGLPLQNALARTLEWQADRFAVRVTQPSTAFASALRRLSILNLADPRPPRWVVWWFYDHPPIIERILAAESSTK